MVGVDERDDGGGRSIRKLKRLAQIHRVARYVDPNEPTRVSKPAFDQGWQDSGERRRVTAKYLTRLLQART